MTIFKLAIICSEFNEPVTSKLLSSAKSRLKDTGYADRDYDSFLVPGAVEIPLLAKRLASTQKYDAIICLGAVIRGETSHYDYVCSQVSQGTMQVSLEFDLPVIFGVLTTENADQAFARAGGSHSDKGVESVDTALSMLELLSTI